MPCVGNSSRASAITPLLHAVYGTTALPIFLVSNAGAHSRVAIMALSTQQQHANRQAWADARFVGGEKIGARLRIGDDLRRPPVLSEIAQADRLLRPRARRRGLFRPPTVAIRARKPWRRLRTRLLGW